MFWLIIEILKNGLVNGALIALLALSFSWIYRTTRVFHIAITAQILVGGYTAVYTSIILNSFFYSIVFSIITTSLFSMILMKLHIHLQIREASNSLRLIASLGCYFLTAGLISLILGNDIKRDFMSTGDSIQIWDLIVTSSDILYLGIFIITIAGLLVVLNSSFGKGITAIGSNRILYSVLGHNEGIIIISVHLLSGILTGICGGVEALRNGVEPYGFLPIGMTAAVAALLGGRSILWGPVIFGLILGILKSITTQLIGDTWVDTSIYSILFLILCLMPRTILAPSTELERS